MSVDLSQLSFSYLLLVILVLALGTSLTRFLPIFVPKKFMQAKWLVALNRNLSLCIMTILTLASLTIPDINHGAKADWQLIGSELLALVLVLAVYIRFKSTLLAVILGIACVNVPWVATIIIACIMPQRSKFTNLNPLKTLRRRKRTEANKAEEREEAQASIDTFTFTEGAVDAKKVARTLEASDKLHARQQEESEEQGKQANQESEQK
ncbi:AzlD domain-containing protein [Psittacicella gerlachiana]|uniref:Branched-subunit amino acid transport protein AzlD n=1 Tax=Psittacicella gerlachiana TaxID=2028574 RepID=A0A3A1YA28_9GAMM|nr:AzlD domain-containing protein [Psittacicella gerlachiana]RIY35012.1 hypothetical protein CKF59_04335 [Psittacicella gerlachiana]